MKPNDLKYAGRISVDVTGGEVTVTVEPPPVMAVHLLSEGLPLCRFNLQVPRDWPAGNNWVQLAFWQDSTCPGCLDELSRLAGEKADVHRPMSTPRPRRGT